MRAFRDEESGQWIWQGTIFDELAMDPADKIPAERAEGPVHFTVTTTGLPGPLVDDRGRYLVIGRQHRAAPRIAAGGHEGFASR